MQSSAPENRVGRYILTGTISCFSERKWKSNVWSAGVPNSPAQTKWEHADIICVKIKAHIRSLEWKFWYKRYHWDISTAKIRHTTGEFSETLDCTEICENTEVWCWDLSRPRIEVDNISACKCTRSPSQNATTSNVGQCHLIRGPQD